MDVKYTFRGKEFDDIREITENSNHRLEIDFDYILKEYLPFQVFISGKTFFKDVFVKATERFVPNDPERIERFDIDLFLESFIRYFNEHSLPLTTNFAAAVSGGVDSSSVALAMAPPIIYSGYYKDDECDERPYSKLIAETIGAKHCTYELTEDDMIDNVKDYVDQIGTPVGGLGGVMEYVTLKKFHKEHPNTKIVLFGNGGDEIFMGYFFNYFVKNFWEFGNSEDKVMSNFLPSKKGITKKLIDLMIIASFDRSPWKAIYSTAIKYILPSLDRINDIVDKLLYVNINVTLPSLLHLNNQFCKAVGVTGLNPIGNYSLIRAAKFINTPMSEIPKWRLRTVHKNMPLPIIENIVKRGFPIPLKTWKRFNGIVKEYYDSFFNRREFSSVEKPHYAFVDRFSWGVFLAELVLRKHYN